MRITFLHPHGQGDLSGGFRQMTSYADYLARGGHEVRLHSRPKPPLKRFSGKLSKLPFRRAPRENTQFVEGAAFSNTVIDELRPLTADDIPDADVLVATWWETVEWALSMPPSKGRPVHFVQDLELFPYLPYARAAAVLRADIPKICVAGWLETALRSDFGASDILTVTNGVRVELFASQTPFAERRGVGTLYSPAPRKRSALAGEAVAAARARGIDVPFSGFSAHDVPSAMGFDTLLKGPSQEAIRTLYGGRKAWLFTSESEGFGLPILEAMAAGTPVIATPGGAAPDLVTNDNGRLVEPTPEAMADAIGDLLDLDEPAWTRLSEGARATAEANRFERMAARFEAALARVAESGSLAQE